MLGYNDSYQTKALDGKKLKSNSLSFLPLSNPNKALNYTNEKPNTQVVSPTTNNHLPYM